MARIGRAGSREDIVDFQLNEDRRAIRDMAASFAREELAPHAAQWDEDSHFPIPVMRKAAELGLAGIYVRDDVGGSALTRLDAALIFEELSKGCTSTAAYICRSTTWCLDHRYVRQ
jgi:alkylation response protein AidB-like acyl-CoA dehydrogenase